MLRDQTERTVDMEMLDKVPVEDLNYDMQYLYYFKILGRVSQKFCLIEEGYDNFKCIRTNI